MDRLYVWRTAGLTTAFLVASLAATAAAQDGVWVRTKVTTARTDKPTDCWGGGSAEIDVGSGQGRVVTKVPVNGTDYTWELAATWQELPERLAPDEVARVTFTGKRGASFEYRNVFGSPYLHTSGWLGVSAEGDGGYVHSDAGVTTGAAMRLTMRADSPEENVQTYGVSILKGVQGYKKTVAFRVHFGAELSPQSEPVHASAAGAAVYTYTFMPGRTTKVPSQPGKPPCSEAANFYQGALLGEYYTEEGSLRHTRQQLVAQMVEALREYRGEGGNVSAGAQRLDAVNIAASMATGAMPTGREDALREAVEAERLSSGRPLSPGTLFKLSLRACNGNVRDALVTCHAVTYRDGGKRNVAMIARNLEPLRNEAGYADVNMTIKVDARNTKIFNPRASVGRDEQGVWYHLFGMAALSFTDEHGLTPFWLIKSGVEWQKGDIADPLRGGFPKSSDVASALANYAIAMENVIRTRGGSVPDPDKQCINYTGAAAGESIAAEMAQPRTPTATFAPGSLSPGAAFVVRSPVSLTVHGTQGESFALDQQAKTVRSTHPVSLEVWSEKDGEELGTLVLPHFAVASVELVGTSSGDATFAAYRLDSGRVQVFPITITPGQQVAVQPEGDGFSAESGGEALPSESFRAPASPWHDGSGSGNDSGTNVPGIETLPGDGGGSSSSPGDGGGSAGPGYSGGSDSGGDWGPLVVGGVLGLACVGVGFGVLAIAVIGLFVARRRKRATEQRM